MENCTTKIYLREDQVSKDGECSLYLRATINRKTRKYSLGISVAPKNWDEKSGRVKRSDLQHLNKNNLIESFQKRANDAVFEMKFKGKGISFDEFERLFGANKSDKSNSFIDFVLEQTEIKYKSGGSYETYRTNRSAMNILREFAKGDVHFSDLDYNFLKRFDDKMKLQKKMDSTRGRIIGVIKSHMNKAVTMGMIEGNPLEKFKTPNNPGRREYLTLNEVKRLEEIMEDEKVHYTIKRALRTFLFCCYTGLRYKDVYELRYKDIKQVEFGDKTVDMIEITMQKTDKPVSIPLLGKAMELIGTKTFDEAKVLYTYSNQPMNRYLKEAAELAQITKVITFHVSRHTFATLLLNRGISIETVSSLVGHSSIRTTQIYAKILPESKINAIEKFGKLFD